MKMTTTPSATISGAIPSIVKEVVVPCAPERAFDLFTARIHSWWPMATHSVGGAPQPCSPSTTRQSSSSSRTEPSAPGEP